MSAITINVLELLSSKICHDLISPIGAIGNGIEFMEEMGADAGDEAIGLLKHSAEISSGRLQAYRMVFGAGGADDSIKLEDVHKIFELFIKTDGKVTQNWDPYAPMGPAEKPAGFCKILMGLFLIAFESLPKGGEIVLNDNDGSIEITATGDNAQIKPLMAEALSGDLHESELDPKLVAPYVIYHLAQRYKLIISIEENGADNFKVALKS